MKKRLVFLILILFLFILKATAESNQITPENFEYLGAFRLPYIDGEVRWDWGGTGATYYPGNNSLYAIGHDHTMHVSEVSIPKPVKSRNLADLKTAQTLRSFTNVRTGVGQLDEMFERATIRRAGIAYLNDKLYLSFGAHFQEEEQNIPSHMSCNLDFSKPAGAWRVAGDPLLYSSNDYMCEIPASWADENVSTRGKYLATGRFRDGGWGGEGPNLFAIAPWQDGNPPKNGATLNSVRLLGYSSTHPSGYDFAKGHQMKNYHHADEWVGAEWLTANDKSAVIFVGTKGLGDCWYGFSDGTAYPTDGSPFHGSVPPYPHDDRGWWSSSYEAQIIFYDPADLAKVAQGKMKPYEPQPYATMNLDQYLYNIDKINDPNFRPEQNKYRLASCAYDRTRNLLYVIEYRGEPAGGDWNDDNPVVHVFGVK
ncbi:MAG: hypothetical protein ABIH69_02130 [bacterium]